MAEKHITKDQWLCTACYLMYSNRQAAVECHNAQVEERRGVTYTVEEDGPDLFTAMQERLGRG